MLLTDPSTDRLLIELDGPDGNVFILIAAAKRLARQLGRDGEAIASEMQTDDYDHACAVFLREFSSFVSLYKNGKPFSAQVARR